MQQYTFANCFTGPSTSFKGAEGFFRRSLPICSEAAPQAQIQKNVPKDSVFFLKTCTLGIRLTLHSNKKCNLTHLLFICYVHITSVVNKSLHCCRIILCNCLMQVLVRNKTIFINLAKVIPNKKNICIDTHMFIRITTHTCGPHM